MQTSKYVAAVTIKFPKPAQSLWSLFQNLKAARDFPRGCLRLCRNLMLRDVNRISSGFARWARKSFVYGDGGMETLLLGYLTESRGTNENKLW